MTMKRLMELVIWASLLMPFAAVAHDNLDLGNPDHADKVVDREGFALGYCEKYEQPLWVQYRMTREEVTSRNAIRTNDFKDDPEIPTGSAKARDYSKSGYDKGHLAPAEDMHFSETTMRQSFYMSNMSPQIAGFNRGVWKRLEAAVRRFAYEEGSIVVVTGPIFAKSGGRTIGDSVAVPTAFYKVVYDETPPCKMIGFIVPHQSSDKQVREFACTVAKVEQETGLRFFDKLPSDVQRDLKTKVSTSEWTFR